MPVVGERIHRVTGAVLADGRQVEVTIEAGRVAAITPASRPSTPDRPGPASPANSSDPSTAGELHLPDWLLLPAATEPHAHLDKAFSWPRIEPAYGDLGTAIESWHGYTHAMTGDDVYVRARRALDAYLAHGITTVRTHVDLLADGDPLRGVEALLRLRAEVADIVDLQLVLLARYDAPESTVCEGIRLGVDLLGGCAHMAPDPAKETVRLLDLAERLDVPLDLHTDEQLGPHVLSIRDLCREVRARGLAGRVTASHCVSLGSVEQQTLDVIVEEIRAAGIGIVSLPITNLYLQGRDHPVLRPRGITALRALLDAGVPVAAGGDNLRDPFNPMGRADPFETTSLLITAGHLDADEALAAVTSGGRQVLGLPPAGPEVGADANFVAVAAPALVDALAGPGDARVVVHRGRLVSRTTVDRNTLLSPRSVGTVRTGRSA